MDGQGDLTRYEPLLDELVALRADMLETLGLPAADRPVFIRLFADADALQRTIRTSHPSLPLRRAYFVDDGGCLSVFVCEGPQLAEDLRHEAAHACLHAVLPDFPLWLDEGLAEYFEVAAEHRGWNARHVETLLHYHAQGHAQGAWRGDLARLERLTTIDDMTQLDYAESWAWVYFLLHGNGPNRGLLPEYLNSLRTGRQPPLSEALSRAIYRPERWLEEHLLQAVNAPQAVVMAPESAVRTP